MLKEFVNRIIDKNLNVFGIVVIRDGEKIAEHHFVPEERRNVYSVTKSFTSSAVGLAIQEGYLSLEDNVVQFIEEDIPIDIPGVNRKQHLDALKQVTVERLLTMSIADYPFARPDCEHWLKYVLSIPLPNVSDKVFNYSNLSAFLVGVMVEKAIKMNVMDYLNSRLLFPLGLKDMDCIYSPDGHFYGASGMKLTVNELSRLGVLYLQKGSYLGRQLLSEEWVESSTKKQIETREGGYGYYFWRYEDNTYRASGKNGQLCIVIPEKNAVIAVMSEIEQYEDVMEMRKCIWDTVYTKL